MRAAIVSTYPPRACGIGTFASDVRGSLLGVDGIDRVERVVVVDEPSRPQRPGLVATIGQHVRGDYLRAARILGRLDVDVVLLQHEYGIYGGADGEYVVSLAEELVQPLVVTLHTVLSQPTAHQAAVLRALCDQAAAVLVMTETARRLLVAGGACPAGKVRVVPHGAPASLVRRAAAGEPQGGRYAELSDRFVLSTFGLLSQGKGLESAIEALPELADRHPELLYVIAGRTHPDVERREGERYRLSLERRVVDLGLEGHVEFDDRFLSTDEIGDLLARTDVFLTPYRELEQISSGALTFAIAAGCAVVSTPYWHAQDLLASGAGTVVPFGDVAALAEAIDAYVEQPELLGAARAEARRIGAGLPWPSVAVATAEVLREAIALAPRRRALPPVETRLATVRTDHVLTLVDDVGIVQHADGVIPNRASGYCVDDVARVTVLAHELARRGDERVWTSIVYRSLAFLTDAAGPGGMRNFMGYDRRWLDEPHGGDHVGRAIWALGELLATAWVPAVVDPTRRLLDEVVASVERPISLRTGAYAVLGLARLDPDRRSPKGHALLAESVEQLADAFERHATDDDWVWFEERLTYDNARLPQALLVGGAALGRDDLVELGLRSLQWLGDESGLADGTLRLTGHRGRGRGEPAPGAGDEQPLDAAALVEAELAALAITGDLVHAARAQQCFDWFLGRNKLQRPLYDFATGGCSDGLGDETANDNEGAESTLAFHRASLLLDAAGLSAVVRRRAPEAIHA